MRKPQVKGGPGRSWAGPGRSWAGSGESFGGFLGVWGAEKKLHFREANRMKLSGTNYPLLKTENLLLIQGSISEKLSLYRIFGTQKKIIFWVFFLAGPVAGRPAPGPGSRAGPGIIEKPARQPGSRHRARVAGDPAPGYGISGTDRTPDTSSEDTSSELFIDTQPSPAQPGRWVTIKKIVIVGGNFSNGKCTKRGDFF